MGIELLITVGIILGWIGMNVLMACMKLYWEILWIWIFMLGFIGVLMMKIFSFELMMIWLVFSLFLVAFLLRRGKRVIKKILKTGFQMTFGMMAVAVVWVFGTGIIVALRVWDKLMGKKHWDEW